MKKNKDVEWVAKYHAICGTCNESKENVDEAICVADAFNPFDKSLNVYPPSVG
ncbi:hypothetical protein ACFLS9_01855 [Bacteroidota bacterium]